MKRLIITELNKSIRNIWFLISVLFGVLCVIVCLWSTLNTYYSDDGMRGFLNLLIKDEIPVTKHLVKSADGFFEEAAS